MTMVADIGTVVNKLITDGQIWGGLAQGIGLALSEDYEDIKKHSTMLGAGIPYPKDIPDNMEIIYVQSSVPTVRSALPARVKFRCAARIRPSSTPSTTPAASASRTCPPTRKGAGRTEGKSRQVT